MYTGSPPQHAEEEKLKVYPNIFVYITVSKLFCAALCPTVVHSDWYKHITSSSHRQLQLTYVLLVFRPNPYQQLVLIYALLSDRRLLFVFVCL